MKVVLFLQNLKFLAMNGNLPDRKQDVRFCVFVVCDLVNFNGFLQNRTQKIDKTIHFVSYRAKLQIFCIQETSRLLTRFNQALILDMMMDFVQLRA